MKTVVKMEVTGGNTTMVTFEEDTGQFSTSDGRSGAFSYAPHGDGVEATFIVGGQQLKMTFSKVIQAPGDSSSFVGPEGSGTATVISRS